jgi:hypothetical protein
MEVTVQALGTENTGTESPKRVPHRQEDNNFDF